MSEKESLNLRLESGLRDHVRELAQNVEGDDRPSDLSKTARKLIVIGIGAERAGIQETASGPLGIPRPFATVDFGGEKDTMGTQLSTSELEDLQAVFDAKKHTAAREALRLGVIIIKADDPELDVTGPGGILRPFAKISIDDNVAGELANQYLAEFRESHND